MSKAVRAIVVKDGKLLLMRRNKYGNEYYTLVGGRVNDGETEEQALVREVKEETGLDVTGARLVFTEKHPKPYNQQHIYLCEVAGSDTVAIQETSEEGLLNRLDMNIHKPMWAELSVFPRLHFRTPQLQAAIIEGLKSGFPAEPVNL